MNILKTFKNLPALVFALLCEGAIATQYNSVTISEIATGDAYNGDVVLNLSNANVNTPGCHTNSRWDIRFDATTDEGKQAYALAMLAWATNAQVTVRGEGFCRTGTNTEQLRWIRGN
jgi:hypothetical protein